SIDELTVRAGMVTSPTNPPGRPNQGKFGGPLQRFQAARRAILNNALRRQQKSLDLSKYGVETLPAEIGRLDKLETLIISRNLLKNLPSEIGQLASLKRLYLYGNLVEDLPPEI